MVADAGAGRVSTRQGFGSRLIQRSFSAETGGTVTVEYNPVGLVCVIDPGRQYSNIFTSMFLHGGWMHLIGNMWFLWLFGNNIEDSMTRPRFLVFYLACGIAAALAQVWIDPNSAIPMVGASGAISGVMGAYLVLYPRVRVYTVVPLGFFIQQMALPAWVMLIYWMVLQLAGGVTGIFSEQTGGVALGDTSTRSRPRIRPCTGAVRARPPSPPGPRTSRGPCPPSPG